MTLLTKTIADLLARAAERVIPADAGFESGKILVQFTKDHQFGELQSNLAMVMAKPLGKKPRDLAEELVAALPPETKDLVDSAEIAGPGFINFRLNPAQMLRQIAGFHSSGPDFGEESREKTVLIDYSSPNIAKRMHIGHLRSTIIGDSLKRIFRRLGYPVIADNHLGDWGTQFGKLMVAYRLWLDPAAYDANPIEELERLYVKFEQESAAAPELLEEARRELKKLQDGDPENTALWKEYVRVSLEEYDKIYRRMGVTFDTYRGESYYHGLMPGVVEELENRGLARESEGAAVVFFPEETNLHPCIVRKNDGAYLYATSDLACIESRMEEYSLDRLIYVTDDRQITHFQQVFKIAEMLGWNVPLVHVPFGVMKFTQGHFSSRKGNVIYLSHLLDEAEKRAFEIVTEKNPALDEADRREIARVVGIGSVKYFDLSQNRTSDIIFDWEKVLSFEGNTAPYLQYGYARIRSLLRKAAAEGLEVSWGAGAPGVSGLPGAPGELNDTERKLLHGMIQFPQVVIQAAEAYKPNLVSDYIFELSQTFNYFYNTFPIIKAEPGTRDFRLFLCERMGEIIRAALDLLGIEVIERM